MVTGVAEISLVEGVRGRAELRAVHGHVGAPDQGGAVDRIVRGRGDADARAQLRAHGAERERRCERLGDARGDPRGLRRVGIHQYYRELVAADPGDHGARVERMGEALANLAEDLIAGGMSEGVVDLLEVLEIDEQECESPWRLSGLLGEEGV